MLSFMLAAFALLLALAGCAALASPGATPDDRRRREPAHRPDDRAQAP
jgi:hypothetical protein